MTEQMQWVNAQKFLQEAGKKIGFHGQDQKFSTQRLYCAPGGEKRERYIHNVFATQQIEGYRIVYVTDVDFSVAVLRLESDIVLTAQILFDAFKGGELLYAWYAPNLDKGAWEARDVFSHCPLTIIKVGQHGIVESRYLGQQLSELAMGIARQRSPFDYSDVTYDLNRVDEIRLIAQSWIEERFSALRKREDLLRQVAELR